VMGADVIWLCPKASCDNHLTVFAERFADCRKAFGFGGVEKSAGIDDDSISSAVIWRNRVTFGAQTRENAFAVHQCFGAAKGHHADAWPGAMGRHNSACEIRAKFRGIAHEGGV